MRVELSERSRDSQASYALDGNAEPKSLEEIGRILASHVSVSASSSRKRGAGCGAA